jgi:hypothetical protein
LCRQFYFGYPTIWQSKTAKLQSAENQLNTIWQFPIAKSQEVFVSQYLIQLPSEDELKNIIQDEIKQYSLRY